MIKRVFFAASLVGLALVILTACAAPAASGLQPGQSAKINGQQYQSQFGQDTSFSKHVLIDVRTSEEFASGHIAGAINIPVDEIGSRLAEIPTDRIAVVYCHSGNRSATAAQVLAQNNYAVYDLGGIIDWVAAGYPVTPQE